MATEITSLLPKWLKPEEPKPFYSHKIFRLLVILSSVAFVIIIVLYIYVRPTPRDLLINLKRGNNIQLVSEKHNLYVRTDSTNLLLTETIPWLHGSTFEQFTEGGNCFRLKTMRGKWLSVNRKSGVISPSASHASQGTQFEFQTHNGIIDKKVSEASPQVREYVKIKVCNENLWWEVAKQERVADDGTPVEYLTIRAAAPVEPKREESLLGVSASGIPYPQNNKYHKKEVVHDVFQVKTVDPIHGVNLGGWFLPEIWMNPTFSNYTGLKWAGSLCNVVKLNRTLAEEKMQTHLSTWIQEADFQAIAADGFNSMRLPVGYWNLIPDPYALFVPADETTSLRYIDWVFDMCEKYSLTVLLDLHGAPGSQNGVDHSGCQMDPVWLESAANLDLTISSIEVMMQRYGQRSCLAGIELVNEPSLKYCQGQLSELNAFFSRAYHTVRHYNPTTVVVFNELYAECYDLWKDKLVEPEFYNVVMDLHLYNWQQPFTSEPVETHIADAVAFEVVIEQQSAHHPVLVGEWCFSTGTSVQAGQPFVDACVESFAASLGWYLWNWKVERGIHFDEWDVQLQYEIDGLHV